MNFTVESLREFEVECCKRFQNGEIRSPMHLSGGNEKELIDIFKNIKDDDWVFTTYRSHYHSLLKGMPKEVLMSRILKNESMHIMSNKYRIVSTAIVGGQIPQAVGAALAIKLKQRNNKVFCFLGDMAASGGIFHDCLQYSIANKLSIKFIIENNFLSTDTPSNHAWGMNISDYVRTLRKYRHEYPNYVVYYTYKRIYPHYGISVQGKPNERIFVDFDKESKT